MSLKKYLPRSAVIAALFVSATAGATNTTWEVVSTPYFDASGLYAPLFSGLFVTYESPDALGHYKILSASGKYGNDQITGLGTRSSRPWDASFLVPDNAISINPTDTSNGCQGAILFPQSTPHFSCSGVSLQTNAGTINLAFGGAVPAILGYSSEFIMARHSITQISAVPEPGGMLLMLGGLAAVLGAHARRRSVNG